LRCLKAYLLPFLQPHEQPLGQLDLEAGDFAGPLFVTVFVGGAFLPGVLAI
jgi:hypothetical protein